MRRLTKLNKRRAETQNDTLRLPGPISEGLAKRKRPNGFFSKMNDVELIEFASGLMKTKNITTKKGLVKEDSGVYQMLRRRKLLGPIRFEQVRRNWKTVDNKGLIRLAQRLMKEKKITTRKKLQDADGVLYQYLRKLKLLESVDFKQVRRKKRDWVKIGDSELVGIAQETIEENGIRKKKELQKIDIGLYRALLARKLIEHVRFEEVQKKGRNWIAMNDYELISFVHRFMGDREIKTRKGLEKTDQGIYRVLSERKLLNRVFAQVEESKHREDLDAVCTALEEFGEEG